MGLLDSLLGGGPPGQSGLSAATKALLLVLAAKAAKDCLAHRQAAPGAALPAPAVPAPGGILGGLFGGAQGSGALGQLIGGEGIGSLLAGTGGAGAIASLVDLFHQNGHGATMDSWVSQGPNQPLQPAQLEQALGAGPLQELEQHTGMPRQTLLQQLAHELPAAIDHVTPQGRLPTDAELAPALQGRTQS